MRSSTCDGKSLSVEGGTQDIAAPLTVGATRLMGNPGGMLYAFEVHASPRKLASGRVGVIHPPEMAAAR